MTKRLPIALLMLALTLALALEPSAALAQLDLELEGDAELDAELSADEATPEEPLADEVPTEPSEEPVPETVPESEPEPELEGEEDAGDAELPAEPEPPAPERAISLHMAAGLGVGSLSFTRPTSTVAQHLPESRFAAAEVLLRLHAWPKRAFSLEAQLAYQTSLGFEVELPILFGLPERVEARVQRAELSVAPRFSFSGDARGLALAVPVGVTLRSFFPKVHQYSVRTHNLGSALVRPELIVPLGELITLRAGPEAHWLFFIEPSLEREGACCSGYALGLQGSVQAAVGETFSVALAYRELHSVIPAAARFEDTERFLTARFGGSL